MSRTSRGITGAGGGSGVLSQGGRVYFEVSVPVVETISTTSAQGRLRPAPVRWCSRREGWSATTWGRLSRGDEPMNIGVLGPPDWARAKQYGVSLVISGVPKAKGEYVISTAAPTPRVRSASSRER